MKFQLTIDCDNAAFDTSLVPEIVRILREEASKLAHWSDATTWSNTLHDINGNTVGRATLSDGPKL